MDWFQVRQFAMQICEMGLGGTMTMLDRRGMEPGKEEVALCLPPDGERVSEDGTKVYLSCRRVESHG